MCLPHNSCPFFNAFKKEVGLADNDVIFEGEFLLDPVLVAQELVAHGYSGKEVHEDYFKKPQPIVLKMLGFEEGSTGWLFSRTVPDDLKSVVIAACLSKGNTPALDALESSINDFLAAP